MAQFIALVGEKNNNHKSQQGRESQQLWAEYTAAKEDMFFYTSTADSPWVIIKSDDKKRARINAIRYFLSRFDYPGKREELLQWDPRIVRSVEQEIGID